MSKSEKKSNINTSLIKGKIPPHSEEAERAILGAMMLDRTAITKVIEILEEDSFYNLKYKTIFKTAIELFEKGIQVDIITLSDELAKKDKLQEIGGLQQLIDINNESMSAANVEYHSRIVQEKFLKRSLLSISQNIYERSFEESTDALEEIDNAENEIFKLAEKRFGKGYHDINSLAHEAMDVIYKLAERDKDSMTGVPTGFKELDKILGGFQNSDLIVIAARPSMGKTALALSIARNVALEYEHPVAFFSIEMAAIQLVIRLLSAESKINAQNIRTGNLSHDDVSTIALKIGKLAAAKMFIDDSASLTITELRAKCRRLKVEHGIKLVMIDYLQLIQSPKAESREREISIISRSLKQLAKELDIPIVAMAQLNRGVEGRQEKRPMLSDLRESGSIEQDADVVMFIYRPEYYGIKTWPDNQQSTENTAEVIVGKQRNGPTGPARLVYQKDYARFENGFFGDFREPMNTNFESDFESDHPF